jgi:regulator of RNase E activity RraB
MRNIHRASSFALLAICMFAACSRQTSDPDDVPDSVVVENLRNAGSDLSKPHSIDFDLYFPDEAAARRVASRLTSQGFAVTVDEGEEDWSVEATRTMVPDADEITKAGKSLRALAESEGGEYDGWGAAVVTP